MKQYISEDRNRVLVLITIKEKTKSSLLNTISMKVLCRHLRSQIKQQMKKERKKERVMTVAVELDFTKPAFTADYLVM